MAVELFSEKIEKALLGLLISKPILTKKIVGLIDAEDFYFNNHKAVFKAIFDTFQKHNSADEILITEELVLLSSLPKNEIISFIADLMVEKGLESNIDKYVSVIKEKKEIRSLEKSLKESVDLVTNTGTSISDLIGQVESKIYEIGKNRKFKDFKNIIELTSEYELKMKQIDENGFQDGLRTKITFLDEKIGGLKNGEFIIIAARPSMGKTAFALEIAKNISTSKNVGFFSLEMPSEQLIKRLISSESNIDQRKFNKVSKMNQLEQARLNSGIQKIKSLNLWIDDSPSLKTGELAWKARRLNDIHNLDLIIIDYLQLIEGDSNSSDNRQQAVSDISRQLKSLARELDIPVISISQLSRRVEQREDKRPQMSDIRESGAIEQDADIIMFLYREDYYKHGEDNLINQEMSDLEVIISKHRNGPTGVVKLRLSLKYGKISSMGANTN